MHARRQLNDASPAELYAQFVEMLDFGWAMALAAERAQGADDETAELRVAARFRREDEQRLRDKIARWERLDRARRSVH